MKLLANCLGLILGGVVTAAAYASVDGSEPVICAAVEIMECVPNNGCQRISAREAGIPRFLQIDFAGQQITRTKSSGDEITSAIERSEMVDGRLILQGAEDGLEGVPDGIGWSLSIDEVSGDMVLTGSGADAGFVIFGACTTF
jgi:hypothetical protein